MPRISEMLPRSPITPTTGMWEAMDADMQAMLSDIAGNVKLLLSRSRGDDAFDEMHAYGLGVEELAAMWTLFESGERRVLKAVDTARKERL